MKEVFTGKDLNTGETITVGRAYYGDFDAKLAGRSSITGRVRFTTPGRLDSITAGRIPEDEQSYELPSPSSDEARIIEGALKVLTSIDGKRQTGYGHGPINLTPEATEEVNSGSEWLVEQYIRSPENAVYMLRTDKETGLSVVDHELEAVDPDLRRLIGKYVSLSAHGAMVYR